MVPDRVHDSKSGLHLSPSQGLGVNLAEFLSEQ